MKAFVLAAVMAFQPAAEPFDLACEIEEAGEVRSARYVIDIDRSLWCERSISAGPAACREAPREAVQAGRFLAFWADDNGYQIVSTDTGFLSGADQAEGRDWIGRCRSVPFSGLSPAT